MEYNTQRPQLKITDYGRHVAKLIDYAKGLADRNERTQMAQLIVEVMAHVNPKVKDRSDYRHILWDHLLAMADHNLDVDCPYPVQQNEEPGLHPKPVPYSDSHIHYRHYGHAMEEMIVAVSNMPEGEERTLLTEQIAHTMKRQYLQWNRDTVDDQLIRDQLLELSHGRLALPDSFEFHDSKYYLDAMAAAAAKKEANAAKKKNKRKKKNNNGKL